MHTDVTNAAESSTAQNPSPIDLSTLTREERDTWRNTGNMPAPKTADSAPAKESSEPPVDKDAKAEPAPDSETGKDTQEQKPQAHKKLTAEERIQQLESTIEKIRKQAGIDKTQKAESSPAKAKEPDGQPPLTYPDWKKQFDPAKWLDGWSKQNPDKTYEQSLLELNDFQDEVREHYRQQEANQKNFYKTVDEARSLYGADYDQITEPTFEKVNSLIADPQVSVEVKRLLFNPLAPHLFYALGKDSAAVDKLMQLAKTDPGEAIYTLKTLEKEVRKQLDGAKTAKVEAKEEKPAKAEEKAPEKVQTRVGAPPAEVNSRGTVTEDADVVSARSGDVRSTFAEWNRKAREKK